MTRFYAGSRHVRGICTEVGRGASARQNLRGDSDQGSPLLQVHATGNGNDFDDDSLGFKQLFFL